MYSLDDGTECRHKHTQAYALELSRTQTEKNSHTHSEREREIHIYIHVRHPTHLENWLLSPLSGDTCYLFCAHIAKQKLVGLVLCALFLRKKKPVTFTKAECVVCVCVLAWMRLCFMSRVLLLSVSLVVVEFSFNHSFHTLSFSYSFLNTHTCTHAYTYMHTYEHTQTSNIHNEQRTRAAATPKNERAQGNMKITATRNNTAA